MQIVLRANEALQQEWIADGIQEGTNLICISNAADFSQYPQAAGYIDLLYEEAPAEALQHFTHAPVLVSSVARTAAQLPPHFVRINGWSTMLSQHIEAYAAEEQREGAASLLSFFSKKPHWVSDTPGFITARVVSMIINEAFLALEEGVSTRKEMNTAMKLGTNYPFGPFEWADRIGIEKVRGLLLALAASQPHYQPAKLLR